MTRKQNFTKDISVFSVHTQAPVSPLWLLLLINKLNKITGHCTSKWSRRCRSKKTSDTWAKLLFPSRVAPGNIQPCLYQHFLNKEQDKEHGAAMMHVRQLSDAGCIPLIWTGCYCADDRFLSLNAIALHIYISSAVFIYIALLFYILLNEHVNKL